MKINAKILIFILLTAIIIFGVAIGYVSLNSRNMAKDDAKQITDAIAREYANKVKAALDADLFITRTLSRVFHSYKSLPTDIRNSLYMEIQKDILEAYPEFIAVGTSWELNAIDTAWSTPWGRMLHGYYREGKEIKSIVRNLNLEGDDPESVYYKIKKNGTEVFKDPEFYAYSETDSALNTNISVPIMDNGIFVGLAGIDVDLERFQKLIVNITPFEDSYAFLVSNNGSFVGHPDREKIGKNIGEDNPADNRIYSFTERIKNGEQFSFTTKNTQGQDVYISFAPVEINKITTPWSIGIVVPIATIIKEANANFYYSLVVGLIGLIILAIIIYIISRNITKPLIRTTKVLNDLAKGEIDESKRLEMKGKDEIAEMAKSVNTLIDGLNRTAQFANQIGAGNLEAEFDLLGEKDVLGNSLLGMRESLKTASDAEFKRKQIDEKANWATQGLAKFGDIVRMSTDDMNQYSYRIISNLVDFVNANQGGIFMINDNDKNDIFVELLASYAFNRRKFFEKRIEYGEGLIGRCLQERKTIYITDVPDDYINISSGLGEANPRNILIVPLIFNDEIYGAIELASFGVFEDHQISFIGRVSETIASSISSVKINLRTARLLKESKMQSEELTLKEEEMRQNLEELQTTQEESDRRQLAMDIQLRAINSSLATMEMDPDGIMRNANELFLATLGYSINEIRGKHHKMLFEPDFVNSEKYEVFWTELQKGNQVVGDYFHISKSGKKICLNTGYTPSFDQNGQVIKIIQYANDITRIAENIFAHQTQIEAIHELFISIELNTKGIIKNVNKLFENITGYSRNELLEKPFGLFVNESFRQSDNYQKLWRKIENGENATHEFEFVSNVGESIYVQASFNSITNLNQETQKVVCFITHYRK